MPHENRTELQTERIAVAVAVVEPRPEQAIAEAHATHGNAAVLDAASGDPGGAAALLRRSVSMAAAGSCAPPDAGSLASRRAWLREDGVADADVEEALDRAHRSAGAALPTAQRERFELAMGHDFGHVRLHRDAAAQDAAEALSAHAFALGADVFFGPGAPALGTPAADRLLAHELTHVVQHDEGRLGSQSGVSSPSDPHEREAYAAESQVVERLSDLDAMPAELGAEVSAIEAAPVAAPAGGGAAALDAAVFALGGDAFMQGLPIARAATTASTTTPSDTKKADETEKKPTSKSYTVRFGGSTFSLTCGQKTRSVKLTGFKGDFGQLQIDGLTARAKMGKGGPSGTVEGRATLAGAVSCSVSGRFHGSTLRVVVRADKEHALWPGLALTEARLEVGDGVSGSAMARFTLPGVEGDLALGWREGKLVASTQHSVALPYFGSVTFDVSVSGDAFSFRAGTEALSSLAVPNATTTVTAGHVEAVDGALSGSVSAGFVDLVGVVAGNLTLAIAGVTVTGSGDVVLTLPGIDPPPAATISVPDGGPASVDIRGLALSVADGAVTGSLDVRWAEDTGLVLTPVNVLATLPGATDPDVSFAELTYTAAEGLSGTAHLELADVGIDWATVPGVESAEGSLTVVLAHDMLVAGSGTATVVFTFGQVQVTISELSSDGLVASVTATITSLGELVELEAPLVITGEYSDGVTTFSASDLAFEIALGTPEIVLSGALRDTSFDPAEGGLTTAADLDLTGGPFGLATAEASIEGGELGTATFVFDEPRFRYPVQGAPVVDGTFDGNLSYAAGKFAGSVQGDASLAAFDDAGPEGQIAFSTVAQADGSLLTTIEGQHIDTPLLVVERLFVQIGKDGLTSDIQLAARNDLPVELIGGIQASWTDQGLSVSGGLEVWTREGESPDLSGSVSLGYSTDEGLWARGSGTVKVDDRIDATANVSLDYSDGKLVIAGGGAISVQGKEPILDFHKAFGGMTAKGKTRGFLSKTLPIHLAGIPGVAGLRGELGLKVGKVGFHGRLSGLELTAALEPWDALGGEAPVLGVAGGFGTDDDVGVNVGVGLHMGVQAYIWKLFAGVYAQANLGVGLAVVNPTVSSRLTWDEEGQIGGNLDVKLPMNLQLIPSLQFWGDAGVDATLIPRKTWAKETWVGRALNEPLDWDVGFSVPWGVVVGLDEAAKPNGASQPDIGAALKEQVLDANPKIKEIVRYLTMAADVIGTRVQELLVMWEGGLEFWDTVFDGEGLEAAQRDQAHLERMMTENIQLPKDIAQHRTNVEVYLFGGPANAPAGKVVAELDLQRRALISLYTNMEFMQEYGFEPDQSEIDGLKQAAIQLSAQIRQIEALGR